jgi:hypothetical protein
MPRHLPLVVRIDDGTEVTADGIPYVVELCFGLHQSGLTGGGGVNRKAPAAAPP